MLAIAGWMLLAVAQDKDSYEDKTLGFTIAKPKDKKAAANFTIRPRQYGLSAAVEHKDPYVYAGVLIGAHPYQLYEGKAEKPDALADDLEKRVQEGWKAIKRTGRKESASPTGERGVVVEFEATDESDKKVALKYWVFNNKANGAPTTLVLSTPAGKLKEYEKELVEILKGVKYLKR